MTRDSVTLLDGVNTFTAIAQDSLSRKDTNVVTAYLPATVTHYYDVRGNLTNDGRRVFYYDDENQLTSVTVSNAWRSEFAYDGLLRRRSRKEYTWQSSTWVKTNEVRYVYDGRLVVQERDANNLALVSYTRGNDLSGTMQGAGGIGGLLARTDNGQLIAGSSLAHAYYQADGNGNITALVNTNQLLAARYDSLGQVTSGKKYWSDGAPVPGQQFEYGFDDIGNRTSTKAGGNAVGSALRSASYSANTLNQYTSRDVPNAFDVPRRQPCDKQRDDQRIGGGLSPGRIFSGVAHSG